MTLPNEPHDAVDALTIGIDLRANTLTVSAMASTSEADLPTDALEATRWATLDIGTRGRLLSLELEDDHRRPVLAISITDPTDADLAVMRTARIPVAVSAGTAEASDPGSSTLSVVFARSGDGFDLSWPSGNQCWRRSAPGPDGKPGVTCAVITSS